MGQDNIKKMIEELYDVWAENKDKTTVLLDSSLLSIGFNSITSKNQLHQTLNELYIDVIEIKTSITTYRLHTVQIQSIDIIEDELIVELSENRTVRINIR
jgi:hypothetical protein